MRGRICRLIQVDTSITITHPQIKELRDILLYWTIQRRITNRNGSIVIRTHIQLVIILQQKWPFTSVQFWSLILRLYHIVVFLRTLLFFALCIYIACLFILNTLTSSHGQRGWLLEMIWFLELTRWPRFCLTLEGWFFTCFFSHISKSIKKNSFQMDVERTVSEWRVINSSMCWSGERMCMISILFERMVLNSRNV